MSSARSPRAKAGRKRVRRVMEGRKQAGSSHQEGENIAKSYRKRLVPKPPRYRRCQGHGGTAPTKTLQSVFALARAG
jgi:hypothetical protein